MRPPVHRPFALIDTLDQWRRCAHERTSLDVLAGVIELAREAGTEDAAKLGPLPAAAGLAFDRHCRLYRTAPDQGQVFVHRWSLRGSDLRAELDPVPEDRAGRPLFALPEVGPLGEFGGVGPSPSALAGPSGLAIDGRDQLYVWEAGSGSLLVWDLEHQELRRRLALGSVGPVDLAFVGERLLGVGPELLGLLELRSDGHLRLRPLPTWVVGVPARIAGDSRGRAYVLVDAGTAVARVIALTEPREPIVVPGASDLTFRSPLEQNSASRAERLVVARGVGESLVCFVLEPSTHSEDELLVARGYDGRGITRTPDDRVVYFGDRGLRHAVAAVQRYERFGRVVGFRLDAGEFQNRWGRVFVDACVPDGTALRIATIVCDDPPDAELADVPIVRTPPVNAGKLALKDPYQPPMPPGSLVPRVAEGQLFERPLGRELPWTIRDEAERRRFASWEGVVQHGVGEGSEAALGRYLWVVVELHGNGRRTPRIRSLRIERAGHSLLARLPRVYSRDPVAAEFLWRYLAAFEGQLGELELRSLARHALLHPQASPEPFLPWLAGMLGLVLDRRWPVAARRQAITEASWLFRFRGTVPGLRRWLELYLGEGRVAIIEHFRVRGHAGVLVGDEGPAASSSVLGAGFRVGGALGLDEVVDITSEQTLTELGADGFGAHAHRFTVVVMVPLSAEQRVVIEHILDQHRPAHTLYQLCTLDAGLRVGVGLHLDISSVVGQSGGWTQLRVDGSVLGRDALLGQARAGTSVGGSRLGEDSEVG